MTQEEKRKIENFMQQGKGYRFIAAEIGLPVNTVKSWIQRNKPKPEQCLQCGSIIHSLPHKKKKSSAQTNVDMPGGPLIHHRGRSKSHISTYVFTVEQVLSAIELRANIVLSGVSEKFERR